MGGVTAGRGKSPFFPSRFSVFSQHHSFPYTIDLSLRTGCFSGPIVVCSRPERYFGTSLFRTCVTHVLSAHTLLFGFSFLSPCDRIIEVCILFMSLFIVII